MSLHDKTMLITGASQGIGRYLSVYFGRRCKNVIGIARSEAGLAQTAQEAREDDARFEGIVADLSDPSSLVRLYEQLTHQNESIDILIHNAADVTSKSFAATSLSEIERQVQTNITGPLQLTQLLLPSLLESEAPSIVTMSSLAGYKANPTQTVYSATKTAVNGIAQALRTEFAPQGVHVLNVALSSVALRDEARPGAVPVAEFAQSLERALHQRQDELYLSGASKWLMRMYQFYPPLGRVR